jgi:hypothetical protein
MTITIVMLSGVVMLSVFMQSVILPSVVLLCVLIQNVIMMSDAMLCAIILIVTIRHYTEFKNILSVIIYRYTECHYTDCRYTECIYTDFHYECSFLQSRER